MPFVAMHLLLVVISSYWYLVPIHVFHRIEAGRFCSQNAPGPTLSTSPLFMREQEATSNKCHASSNRCLTSSNKKLLVTSALLVVTRSPLFMREQCHLVSCRKASSPIAMASDSLQPNSVLVPSSASLQPNPKSGKSSLSNCVATCSSGAKEKTELCQV